MSLYNKISYGLYLIASTDENKSNACIINTLIQLTSVPEQVSVTVNKLNLTHDYILKSGKCCALLLDTDTRFEVFKSFGMRSGKTVNKYENIPTIACENGVILPDIGGIGYFELKVNKSVDVGTHTVFVCDVTAIKAFADSEPLTYAYYHANIKPRPAISSVYKNDGYVCKICGYVHNDRLPQDFICPVCKHGTEVFEPLKNQTAAGENNRLDKIYFKGEKQMGKFICSVCGYAHEGRSAPLTCPQCGVPASKFVLQSSETSWAAEHVVGIAKDAREDIVADLRANFNGECAEVGMYLAMSRIAVREGYPEIGAFYEKAAWEEAEHAAKFAELLGEVVTSSTKKNLELRADAENGATLGKFELAKKAKELNLDAIHDTVHEMARDEARHGKGFLGLLRRYFD